MIYMKYNCIKISKNQYTITLDFYFDMLVIFTQLGFKWLVTYQEFISQSHQKSGRNSAHIFSQILGAANFSYRIKNNSLSHFSCHCHKIDFIIFSSFCFVFILFFQIIIINIFFHHSKKNANVMTRKKMVFFSRKMRQHRQAYVLELRELWGFLLASFLVNEDSNCWCCTTFFIEYFSQSDQNSDWNSAHIINQILGAAADYSNRI